MPLRLPLFVSRHLSFPLSICSCRPRNMYTVASTDDGICQKISPLKKQATLRFCSVSSHMTELLELPAEDPSLHVLFIPGNPGVILYYKEFVEALYELLGGTASVTAIGHISQTRKNKLNFFIWFGMIMKSFVKPADPAKPSFSVNQMVFYLGCPEWIKNWEHGRLFSLQDQIDHKMDFIKQEMHQTEVPLFLVGHSIGSYISLEIFKRVPEQVKYFVGLYPFLTLDKKSFKQSVIGKISASPGLCVVLSSIVAMLGLLPSWATRVLVRRSLGYSWTSTAVEATCTHLLRYHCMRNVLFMAMTEFIKLSEVPDWTFIRGKQGQIAFLFGIDDHWGPLTMFEEISKEAPDVALSIEREGHTHSFSCTEAGSIWVAQHVVRLIKRQCQDASGKQ